jgi:multisubunit Na+/H+ antiporter MnhE subunit
MGPDGGGGAIGAALAWVGWWVVSAALWLFLVDNTHFPELVVGAGVAALGACAAVVVRQERRVILRPRLRWLTRAWRPVAVYPRDLWLLVVALPRRSRGRLVALPAPDLGDDTRGAAQRVLLQTAASFAPNTYVIGTDSGAERMLVHQLVDRGRIELDADPMGLL